MRARHLPLFASALLLGACQDQQAPSAPPPAAQLAAPQQLQLQAPTQALWSASLVQLQAALAEARQLRTAVKALLAQPSDAALAEARDRWHRCHGALLESQLLLALAGANPSLFAQLDRLQQRIEGWPIQPGYLDYYDVYSRSGLVNDISLPITARALRQAHQQFDPDDRSLGLHPMAYLLWGERGQRPAADYQAQQAQAGGQDAPSTEELPSNRRRALLGLMVELLVDDLVALESQWAAAGKAAQLYQQFSPEQRAELWRMAALHLLHKELLERQLLPALAQFSQPDPDVVRHLPYAGRARAALLASLSGLAELLGTQAGRELLGHWSRTGAEPWLSQLQASLRALEKLPESGDGTETQWLAATASVQQLAQLLLPPETATNN